MAQKHASAPPPAMDKHKLMLLITCLVLAVVATVLSLWYNLHRTSGSSDPLIHSIVERLQSVHADTSSK